VKYQEDGKINAANNGPPRKAGLPEFPCRQGLGRRGVGTMITMNAIDRCLSSEGAPSNDPIPGEIPGGLLHAAARDGSRSGSDGWTLLVLPSLTAAMASGPPACVNRMVRRWISRQAFGTERFSSPAE
jgi:hypothetical protein